MVRSRYEKIFVISFPEPRTRVHRPGIENGRSGNEDLDRGSVFSQYGLLYKKIANFRLFFSPAILAILPSIFKNFWHLLPNGKCLNVNGLGPWVWTTKIRKVNGNYSWTSSADRPLSFLVVCFDVLTFLFKSFSEKSSPWSVHVQPSAVE